MDKKYYVLEKHDDWARDITRNIQHFLLQKYQAGSPDSLMARAVLNDLMGGYSPIEIESLIIDTVKGRNIIDSDADFIKDAIERQNKLIIISSEANYLRQSSINISGSVQDVSRFYDFMKMCGGRNE